MPLVSLSRGCQVVGNALEKVMVEIYHDKELSKPANCVGEQVLPYCLHLVGDWGKAILRHCYPMKSMEEAQRCTWLGEYIFCIPADTEGGSASANGAPRVRRR